jgi:purine-binding chemotaxis protein CheW
MHQAPTVQQAKTKQQYCTFYLGEHWYGVDVLKVQEVVRSQPPTHVPLAHPMVRGLINLRGQIVTAIDLRKCLGLPDAGVTCDGINVVLHTDDGAVSLIVDEVGDVLELSEEQIESPPNTLFGPSRELIRGVFKLPERLLIVLDPDQILTMHEPSNNGR